MASSKISKTAEDLATLRLTINSTLGLINQFTTPLSTSQTSPSASPSTNAPNPLDVVHTTATLLKAQTTKLSLLVLNTPFTPSAMNTILRDVSTSCLPALMSAVEICDPVHYSKTLQNELRLRVRRVLREFASLLGEIPAEKAIENGSVYSGVRKDRATRDQLASTGIVWEACESLIALRNDGLVGLVVKKAEDWRSLIRDAIAELKEWSVDEADSGADYEEDANSTHGSSQKDASGNGNLPDEEDFDAIFGAAKRLPKSPSALRTRFDISIAQLSLIQIPYEAVIKRRLKAFPPLDQTHPASTPHFSALDQLMSYLELIPSETDELASAFYELNQENVTKHHDQIIDLTKKAALLIELGWNDEGDAFTKWSRKLLTLLDENSQTVEK